jgi:hypothetical protein
MARKQKTIHYLYKTTCLVTGRYYIGMHSTNNLDDGYMGSGKRLRYSMRKHGIENHKKEIIKFFETRELLVEAEKKAITPEMITDNNCMNIMCGGNGGYVSEEHYKKTSKIGGKIHSEKMKNDSEYRIKVIKTASENMKKAWINGKAQKSKRFSGKIHSEETKKLIGKIKQGTGVGEANSQYGTCWITKDGENKKIKKEYLNSFIQVGWVKGRKD